MFKKMRQTILIIIFKNSTDILYNIKTGSLFRFFIITDKIGQSVIQFPGSDSGINRRRFCQISLSERVDRN